MRRETLRELPANEGTARAAPLVNCLIVVANNGDSRACARKQLEQTKLRVIDILKLIDDEMFEALTEAVTRCIIVKRAHGIDDEIIEGAKRIVSAALFVARIDRDKKVIRSVTSARGTHQHRLPFANRFETTLSVATILFIGMFVSLGEFLANHIAHDAQNLAAVGDKRHARHCVHAFKMPHDSVGQRVPCLHAQFARRNTNRAETRFKTLLRSLVEHDRAHMTGLHAAHCEFAQTMHHRGCLAAPCDRKHGEMRVTWRFDNRALFIGEMQHATHGFGSRRARRKSSRIAQAASASRNAFFSPCVRPVLLSFSSAAKLDSRSS